MARSVEWPDLERVEPRWYTPGRRRTVQLIVVHHTAGSEGPTSAEAGAAYDARRPERVSCHYFHDSNSTVQGCYTWDTSWTAHAEGNARGIHHELCGTLQTRAQWLDPVSDATLWLAARQMARDAIRYAIPVRRLTIAQMRAGERGFCGHGDVVQAWGQGDHTDPGPWFPWDVLLARVQRFLTDTSIGEDDMKLVRWHGSGAVFATNGVTAYWVRTPARVAQIGAVYLDDDTPDVELVTDPTVIGHILGPIPEGWPVDSLSPNHRPG